MPTKKSESQEVVTVEDIKALSVDISELANPVTFHPHVGAIPVVSVGSEVLRATTTQVEISKYKSSAMAELANSLDDLARKGREEDDKSIKEYLMALSAGIDPQDLQMSRYVPIRIYLKKGDKKDDVFKAVSDFSDAVGFNFNDLYEPRRGSWFQKIVGKSKDVILRAVTDADKS